MLYFFLMFYQEKKMILIYLCKIHLLLVTLTMSQNTSNKFIKRNLQMEQDPLMNVAKE